MPKPETNPRLSVLLRLLQKLLITPTPVPTHPDEQRRAQALLMILLAAFFIGSITSIIRYTHGVSAITTNIGLILLIVLYTISRWRFYKFGIYATILIASLLNPLVVAIIPDVFDPMTAVSAALIAIVLADLLAAPRTTLLVFAFNLTLLVGTALLIPDANNFQRIQWVMPLLFVSPFIIIKSYVTQHDVRQLRSQTEKLHANQTQFDSLFNAMPEAVIIKSQTSGITYCNERAARLMGFTDKVQVIGLSLDNFIKPGQSSRLKRDESGSTLTIHYRDLLKTVSDEKLYVQIVATTLAFDDELATLMVLRREETTEIHSDEYVMLKAVAEHTKDAICITDADMETEPRIVFVNPAYTQLTGYATEELIGKPASILSGADHREKWYEVVAKRKPVRGTATNYRKDGKAFEAEWEIVPVGNQEQLRYLLTTMRDVSLQRAIELDLSNKQERFAMMSELMSDYAYALEVNPDGSLQFQWITGAYQEIVGRPYDELLTHGGWGSFVHHDEHTLYQIREKALLTGEAGTIEYRIVHPDGTMRWVSDSTRPIKNENGQVIAIYGAAHDVTERILAHEALRTDAVQKAVIAELGLMALRITNQDDLLNHTLMLCHSVLESSFSMITTCDNSHLRVVATIGDYPDIAVGTQFSVDSQSSLSGYALTAPEPVIIANIKNERRFSLLREIQAKGITSACAVVIQGATEPYGVLTLYAKEAQHFSEDDMYFLQSVANVLATFIERLRAQQAEQEEHNFAEILREATLAINAQRDLDEVLESILVALSNFIMSHVRASILLLDEDSQTYRFVYLHGFPPEAVDRLKQWRVAPDEWGTLRHMLESGQTLIIPDVTQDPLWTPAPDVHSTRSVLGVPIVVQEQTIGFIFLDGEYVAAFSQKDAERLQTLADKIGNAILNARHAEQLQQMVDKATAELRQEQEQLEAILDATGEGIFYTENGVMRYANQTMADLTGFALHEFIGTDTAILHPVDATDAELALLKSSITAIERGDIWRDEVRLRRKDGTHFMAALTISRVGQIKDGMRRAVIVVRDISHEKVIEELRDRFIANAAHELRTPITNLNTSMYHIRKQPVDAEKHLDKLERIIERMNRLVADLLDIGALEDGRINLQPAATILQTIVHNVVDLQTAEADKKSIQLINEMSGDPIQIWADTYRMEQVFTNLMSNAIRHTPENGQIRIYCMHHTAEREVVIVVEDNGEGIPVADIKHIFQPFYRVGGKKDAHGTGLGLSITREIVTRHNGTIGVESTLGRGTSFYITLPTLGD